MSYDDSHSNSHWWWALGISAVAAAVTGIYLWQREPTTDAVPASPQVAAPAPVPAPDLAPPSSPEVQHPVAPAPAAPVLPALTDSDTVAQQALAGVLGSRTVQEWFITDQLIRRIVATVDNLPREKIAQRLTPVKPVGGSFGVLKDDDMVLLSAENAQRYEPYVVLLSKVDAPQAISLYRQFYPLFQRAYEELGYPTAYFNDRVVAVIDHLLATPNTPARAKLTQPKVLYEFADPELQARSAGQKTLLRMGNANAAKVKGKLREFRAELARKS